MRIVFTVLSASLMVILFFSLIGADQQGGPRTPTQICMAVVLALFPVVTALLAIAWRDK